MMLYSRQARKSFEYRRATQRSQDTTRPNALKLSIHIHASVRIAMRVSINVHIQSWCNTMRATLDMERIAM